MKYLLMVEGMSCSHCEKAVSDALSKLTGAKDISVNLDSKQVTVSCECGAQTVKDTVDNQGYDVTSITELG